MLSQARVRNYEYTGRAARQTQRKWGNVRHIQLFCATDYMGLNCPFFKINGSLDWVWTVRGCSGADVDMSDSFDPLQRSLRRKKALVSLRYGPWG